MIYIFDTNSFRELEHFYPEIFVSVWDELDKLAEKGIFLSTREVWREMERGDLSPHLEQWLKEKGINKIFTTPSPEETQFITTIFSVKHFRALIGEKQLLRGTPVADPFVIACAKIKNGTVVTEEKYKPNAAKIPNVCKHFDIPCINLEQLMQQQGWKF
ncbi:hypothetical protein AGMMS50276_25450 [Synergistales bacterium]|nr:hypothetical protein AGMMS50276_25450 [Synergistales bacterium]